MVMNKVVCFQCVISVPQCIMPIYVQYTLVTLNLGLGRQVLAWHCSLQSCSHDKFISCLGLEFLQNHTFFEV